MHFSYYCNSGKELAKIRYKATPNFKEGEEIQSNLMAKNRELTVYEEQHDYNRV